MEEDLISDPGYALREQNAGIRKLLKGTHFYSFAAVGLLLVYLFLAAGMSLTKAPICDEGWYADPALNLLSHGNMGSPVREAARGFLKIDRYTYYTVPVYILAQAGWYGLFGAGLLSMRALSTTAGLLALISWYVITWKLTNSRGVALLVLLLAELDTTFIALAATGGSDMLSAGLGAAAQASYLLLRAHNLTLALVVSHSFVAASGLTHPLGGLVSLLAVLFLQFYMDRDRLAWPKLALVALPYIVGALGWGLYIAQSQDAFWSQFSGNSSERLWPFAAPLLAIKREIFERFIGGFRVGSSSWTPLASLRLFVLGAYLGSVLFLAFNKRIRRSRLATIVLADTAFALLLLLFCEGSKQPWYPIHTVWPLAAALAISTEWCWRQWPRYRLVLTLFVLGIASIEVGYPALLMMRNSYRNSYSPSIAVLKDQAKGERSVMGSAELGFGLGFDHVIDDHNFGYYTHRQPPFIVVDLNYRGILERLRKDDPAVYRYVQTLLASRYDKRYSNDRYTVWARLD